MKNFDTYFKSAFTVDNVIFGFDNSTLKVLLIKRKEAPYIGEWALPGYFVQTDEDLDTAAIRVLKQLAGLENVYLEQIKSYSAVDRHPFGRVITVAYFSLVKIADFNPIPDNDVAEDVAWFDLSKTRKLAFDHEKMIQECFQQLKKKIRYQPFGLELLPQKFPLTALQHLYEAVLEKELDKRNFRKKILSTDLLTDTTETQKGVAHRPAKLYRFNTEKYDDFLREGFTF